MLQLPFNKDRVKKVKELVKYSETSLSGHLSNKATSL